MDQPIVDPFDLQQYRALFEQTPTMLWRAGHDGRCDHFNAQWLAFTGCSLQDELRGGWAGGIHPDDVATAQASYEAHFARRQAFEIQYRRRRFDGVYRAIVDRGAPFTDAAGTFAGFVGSAMDPDGGRSRGGLSGAHEFFEMSLDHLCVVGFDGFFKEVNPSWARTLGWTEEELLARPSSELVHPDDLDALLVARANLRSGSPVRLRNRYRAKDGTYRWFEWRSVSNVDRGLVYGAARDITEQKQAEERLHEAHALQEKLRQQLIFSDRMASVGTLAAGAAHEINNPLGYITANVSMLIDELRLLAAATTSKQYKDMLEMAMDAEAGAARIGNIVRGLTTFSRPENLRHENIDVRRLLDLSANMAINEIRPRGRLVKSYGTVPLVKADEGRLGQVFINLLVNAAQALPEGESAVNEIEIATATNQAGQAVVEIRDSGRGIPATIIDRIFDPFFTTKPIGDGIGLGLSICHNIVAALGGKISVASQVGQVGKIGRGTIVTITLPPAPG